MREDSNRHYKTRICNSVGSAFLFEFVSFPDSFLNTKAEHTHHDRKKDCWAWFSSSHNWAWKYVGPTLTLWSSFAHAQRSEALSHRLYAHTFKVFAV